MFLLEKLQAVAAPFTANGCEYRSYTAPLNCPPPPPPQLPFRPPPSRHRFAGVWAFSRRPSPRGQRPCLPLQLFQGDHIPSAAVPPGPSSSSPDFTSFGGGGNGGDMPLNTLDEPVRMKASERALERGLES